MIATIASLLSEKERNKSLDFPKINEAEFTNPL